MIKITRIKSKNIFSIGVVPVEIILDKYQTNVLTGNSGEGKTSSLADPICLLLYNNPFRSINKSDCINCYNNTDSIIEGDVENGLDKYTIIRGLKPAKFEIYKNGQLVNLSANVTDYQKYLENVVLGGMNEKVFRQIVIMGSAIYRPFMQLPAANRREVIEELLDIRIFSSMGKITKDKLSDLSDKMKTVDNDIFILEEKIKLQENNEIQQKQDNSGRKLELEQKVTEEQKKCEKNVNRIKELQDEKSLILQNNKKLGNDPETIKKTSKSMLLIEAEENNLNKTIQFFRDNPSCPTCRQGISHDHSNHIIVDNSKKLLEYQEASKKLSASLLKQQTVQDEYNQNVTKINAVDQNIFMLQNEITTFQRAISLYQTEISKIENSKVMDNLGAMIDQYKKELSSKQTAKKDLEDTKNYLDITSKLLKDGGIKTKIIKQYLPMINQITNEYLVRLNLPVNFTLDEEFNEVIKSQNRNKFKYNNFSEGEKHRIDMALMLTWRKIAKMKNTINTNLLIMDEVFDKNLNSALAEEFLNILKETETNTNIFIISHLNNLTDKVDNAMLFQKVGNFTVMTNI